MAERADSRPSLTLGELLRRGHALGERADESLRGRLSWALGAGAASAAGGATLLELWPNLARSALPFCLLANLCSALLGFVWVGRCRDGAGALRRRAVQRKAQAALRLLAHDLGAWPRAPKLARLLIASRLCSALGFSALAFSSFWDLCRRLAGVASSPRLIGMQLFGCAALGLSQLAHWARRAQAESAPAELEQCQLAAREYPAVVDLSQPLELDTLFLQPTLLHEIMDALAAWQGTRSWPSRAAYTVALQHHLQSWLPHSSVERECWLGDTRAAGIAALVVDDTVLIEVQRGFSARRAGSALAQVRACAESAPGKPIVLVVFDASCDAVSACNAGDSLRSLHETSAFVAACMPGSHPLAAAIPPRSSAPERSARLSSVPPSLG